MSIRRRLFLVMAAVAALGFVLALRYVVSELRPRHQAILESGMVDSVHLVAHLAAQEWHSPQRLRALLAAPQELSAPAQIYHHQEPHFQQRLLITDAQGQVIIDLDGGVDGDQLGADHSRWRNVRAALRGDYGARATRRVADDARSTDLHVSQPIMVNGAVVGSATVVRYEGSIESFITTSERALMVIFAYLTAGLGLLGLLLSLWATRPIKALMNHVQRVRHDRHAPLPRLGPSDIQALGQSFDDLRQELEGRRYVEHYVQALSHELKSPLSALRGAAELLAEDPPPEHRQRFVTNITHEVERCSRILDQLFRLAELERRGPLHDPQAISLSELIKDGLASWQERASSAGVELHGVYGDTPTVWGERELLALALSNLLANAIDHAPAGSSVTVTLSSGDGQAIITVSDQGPGIPQWAQDKVFERFVSLPGADGRKSSGLGLSLVKEIAELHRGSIRLNSYSHGGGAQHGGTTATLEIPLAKPGNP